MGFFTKNRTYISTETLKLMEDTPDIMKQSVIDAVLGNKDIAGAMIDTTLNAFNSDAKQYYEFGRDKYVNGLPEGSIGYYEPDLQLLTSVLEKEFPQPEGKSIQVVSSQVGIPDRDFLAIYILQKHYQYDLDTNIFYWHPTDNPNRKYKAEYIGADFGDRYWDEGKFTVTFKNLDLSLQPIWESYPTLMYTRVYPKEYNYTVAFVVIDDETGAIYKDYTLWVYRIKSNKYPELNLPPEAKYTQYMPILPLRTNFNNHIAPSQSGTRFYKDAKRMLNMLGLNIKEMHKGITNNPDIKEVNHAYMVFGIDLYDTNQYALRYLYDFFDDLASRSKVSKNEFMAWYEDELNDRQRKPGPINTITIEEGSYKVRIEYAYVNKQVKRGKVSDIGVYTRSLQNTSGYLTWSYDSNAEGHKERFFTFQHPDNKVIYRYQATAETYIEIEVGPISLINLIAGSDREYHSDLANRAEGQRLIIPLNVSIIDNMAMLDRNKLYYASLRIVFNAFKVVKLKWYQTGFFKAVSIIIAVAITIFSGGGLSGISVALTSLAAAGVLAIGLAIAKGILISLAASYAFRFVAEEFGMEWAALAAAVAIIYGAVGSNNLTNLPMADDLLFLGSAMQKVGIAGVQEELVSLSTEMAEITEYYQAKQEELVNINKELNQVQLLDPLGLYTQVGMTPMDTPSTYIQRSLGVNMGLQSITAVSTFVDNSLRLPTL